MGSICMFGSRHYMYRQNYIQEEAQPKISSLEALNPLTGYFVAIHRNILIKRFVGIIARVGTTRKSNFVYYNLKT